LVGLLCVDIGHFTQVLTLVLMGMN